MTKRGASSPATLDDLGGWSSAMAIGYLSLTLCPSLGSRQSLFAFRKGVQTSLGEPLLPHFQYEPKSERLRFLFFLVVLLFRVGVTFLLFYGRLTWVKNERSAGLS